MLQAFSKKLYMSQMEWDPLQDREPDILTATASVRIKRDLMSLYTDPPVGIFAVGDEVNLKIVHALIVGPEGTPYDGGFFYFILKFPNNYPIQPPKVKLMTTDAGQVRFNPNFYNSGKVCVSILGTWVGPPWSPAQQLSSILVTIQSLMTENPFYNEPGFECRSAGEAKVYRNYVQYHTLRAAICGMVENETCLAIPIQLKTIMEKLFLSSFDLYIETAEKYSCLNGSLTTNTFSNGDHQHQIFQFDIIIERLKRIKINLEKRELNKTY